ncbi:MAG: hypothetical protein ACI8RA_002098 [Chlamydiales bacterium]|jgi:hypothetical protein
MSIQPFQLTNEAISYKDFDSGSLFCYENFDDIDFELLTDEKTSLVTNNFFSDSTHKNSSTTQIVLQNSQAPQENTSSPLSSKKRKRETIEQGQIQEKKSKINPYFENSPNKTHVELKKLETKYSSLFSSPALERIVNPQRNFGYLLDVPMDTIAILKVETEKTALGTTGVATCIALCARGKTASGDVYLALCHKSSLCSAETACFGISDSLMEQGCSEDSIEIFAVGGQFSENLAESTYLDEKELLELSAKYPLKGAHLHISPQGDYGVEVVLTSEEICYSEENLFESIAEWDAKKDYSEMRDVFDYCCESPSDSSIEDEISEEN